VATVSQLQRIGELVERLRQLGDKRRGMPVEADDWNELVDVLESLLEVERAQERGTDAALEEGFARKDHRHLGDIGLESLDAELRGVVGSIGGGSSVSTRLAFADVEKKVESLGGEVGRLTGVVSEQQTLIDRTSVDERERSTKLLDFERRFEGVEDLRGLVGTITADVKDVGKGVDTVLELAKSLSDDEGNPIDVDALRQQLEELAALRANLEGVDGQLLRLRDFEMQIEEIRDVLELGVGSSLDERINALRTELQQDLSGQVEARAGELREELLASGAEARAALEAQLVESFGTARGEVEATLAARAAETEGTLEATLATRVEEVSAALTAQLETSVASRAEDLLPGLVSGAVATARAELSATLRAELTETLAAELETRVAASESRIGDRFAGLETELRTRLDEVPGFVAAQVDAELPELVNARMESAVAELEAAVAQEVKSRVAQARAHLEGVVEESVAQAMAAARAELDQLVVARVDERLSGLDDRIAAVASLRVAELESGLLAAVDARIAGLELDARLAALRDQVAAEWRTELSAAISDLTASLTKELEALKESFARELESQLGKIRADLESWREEVESRLLRLESRVFG